MEMKSFKTSRRDIDVNGSEEARDSPQPLALLSPLNIGKQPEPDDFSDKTANSDFRSKLDYFKALEDSDRVLSTETKRQKSLREGSTSEEGLIQCTTLTSLSADTERPSTPGRKSKSTSIHRKQKTNGRSASPRHDDKSANGKEESESKKSSLHSNFSPDCMEVFQQPMCLVRTEERKLIIEDKTVEQINKIPWPMIIVAVAGLYRTGKSYLMNVLAGSNKGFALGNTIQSTTKGIWVWCKIHPKKTNTVLMLLDTEGLGDVEKGDPNHDNKIFTLATLLCNCLVYNMKGAFDQDAVSKLTCITEMSKHIRFRGSQENEYLNLVLPELALCLRDFSLKFVKDDRCITADEYLEECLEEKKGRDDTFNKPRECIRKYFPVRKCFAFPVPGDSDVIENLETRQFSDLSTKFQQAIDRFVSYIFSLTPKELLASKPITGQMFKTLATRYVTDIGQDTIPDVDEAFRATAEVENIRIKSKTLRVFKNYFAAVKLPAPSSRIEAISTIAQRKALYYLRENLVLDKDGLYELSTQKAIEEFLRQLNADNTRKIRDMCDERLQNKSTPLRENINENLYKAAGGHKKFLRDLNKLKNMFMSDLRDFEKHEILWTWYGFLKTLESTESEIIEADEHFSQLEKEDERKYYLEQITRMNEKHEQDNKRAMEEQQELMEEHYKKIHKEREAHFEKEKQKYMEITKLKLERKKAIRAFREFEKQQQEKKKKWIFGRIKDAIVNK